MAKRKKKSRILGIATKEGKRQAASVKKKATVGNALTLYGL